MLYEILLPLAAGALLIPLLPRRWAPSLGLLSLAASLALAAQAVRSLLNGHPPEAFNGILRLDAPGALVLCLVLGLGFLAALVSSQTEKRQRRFYALLLAFTGTMSLTAIADNLGILWAGIEATTLSSALLVGHHRTREATEAAWKYLILSSAGITLAFVATLFLIFASREAGATTLSWSELLDRSTALNPDLVRLAFVLAVIGYGTKAGLVPMHFWLPDAHSEAPSPVSALLSGVLLSCALLAVDRVHRVAQAAGAGMDALLMGFGAASVLVGGLLVLGARNYKRLLAHSSVENMGLVAFALGLGAPLALAGAYLHILAHGVAKSLAFFSAGRIHHHTGTKNIADLTGLLATNPTPARGLLLGFLALAGVPLLAPFTSKLMILAAALPRAPWPLTVMTLLGLAFAFAGFLRHAASLMTRLPDAGTAAPAVPIREPWSIPATITLLVAANVVLGTAGPYLLHALLAGVAVAAGGTP